MNLSRTLTDSKFGNATISYSESVFSINHGFDSIVHVLDEVSLGSAESSLVGDIEDGFG